MTDPNTPITPNPQDLIDQALGGASATTPTPTPTDVTEPATAEPTPTLPVPEPLTTPTPETTLTPEPIALPVAEPAMPEVTDSIPTVEPAAMPEPPSETKPMGEDMPLAFAGGAALDGATTQQPVSNITTEPITPASVPPAITNTLNTPTTPQQSKKPLLKVAGLVAGVLAFVMVGGYVAFNALGGVANPALVAVVSKVPLLDGVLTPKQVEKQVNEDIKKRQAEKAADDAEQGGGGGGTQAPAAPNYTSTARVKKPSEAGSAAECSGCSAAVDGGWLVWRNGECKVTGICNSSKPEKNTDDPMTENANTPTACQNAGGTWCSATDLRGQTYGFCNGTSGAGVKTCQTLAAEKGYSVVIGAVECKCVMIGDKCTGWVGDHEKIDYYWDGDNYNEANLKEARDDVDAQCAQQYASAGSVGFGEGSYLCKLGKEGKGGVVYTGGRCTAANGFPYKGGNCFCGTVQKDTPQGHVSYKSTCGCEEEEETTTSNPSPSPSAPVAVSLMCTGLTRTPTTTPAVGDKVTFTCVGASTPAGAVSLTYKFRYSLNNGAYVAMTNKTATTSELTIAACGSYKVQCQTCGTINGVLTCDPNWVAATQ